MRYSPYLFIACLLLPGVLAVNIAGVVITPLRAVGILFFFIFVPKLFVSSIIYTRVVILDILAIVHCLWVFFALWVVHDLSKAIEAGGMYTLEFLPFYAFGRIITKNVYSLISLLRVMMLVMIVSALLAWIEALTGTNVVYKILGLDFVRIADSRLGLDRASVYMPHPILYGLFTSMLAALMIYALNAKRLKTTMVLILATFPALSSAPLISLFLQLAISTYDYVLRFFKYRWRVLIGVVLLLVLVVSVVTDGGISGLVVNYMTFNPQTGFYRMAIWDYGSAEVINNPFFGLGYNDWIRPAWMHSDSVDNFWLLTAMRYGLPGLALLFVLQYSIVTRFVRKSYGSLSPLKVGWVISFVGIFIVGSTVHFWANAFASYAFFLGIGAGLSSYSNNVLTYFRKGGLNETRG